MAAYLTKEHEREFDKLFNEFISSDGIYLPDKSAYMYWFKKGLESKHKCI